MKSKLIPGYEFEYTLDGVLAPEYDEQLHKKYYIDYAYLYHHEEELLNLPDACVAFVMFPSQKKGERFMNDLDVDGKGTLGIYQWVNLFGKMYDDKDTEKFKEDNIRMALDLVKKYPEHKDLVELIDEE